MTISRLSLLAPRAKMPNHLDTAAVLGHHCPAQGWPCSRSHIKGNLTNRSTVKRETKPAFGRGEGWVGWGQVTSRCVLISDESGGSQGLLTSVQGLLLLSPACLSPPPYTHTNTHTLTSRILGLSHSLTSLSFEAVTSNSGSTWRAVTGPE